MKLERLMNLVAALLHTRVPLSAATIREQVGGYSEGDVAFHRQFSRDKEDLRELGVPILVESVPAADPPLEGYRIDPDEYYLPDPGLEDDELAALHLATRLIAVQSAANPHGLFKLGGMTDRDHTGVPPRAEVPVAPGLGVLFEAIAAGHLVGFDYRDRRRSLRPEVLGFRGGYWYVSGWDLEADADRLYRLDRMTSGVIDEGTAPAHAAGDVAGDATIGPLQPWRIGGSDSVHAKLRVDPVVVPPITAQLGEERITTLEADGSAIVELDVANPDGFVTWVLGFAASVEVLEPAALREQILDRVRLIAQEPR